MVCDRVNLPAQKHASRQQGTSVRPYVSSGHLTPPATAALDCMQEDSSAHLVSGTGMFLFAAAYMYALMAAYPRAFSKASVFADQVTPYAAYWAVFSPLVLELATLLVIVALALFLWHYIVVEPVRNNEAAVTAMRAAGQRRATKTHPVYTTALERAFRSVFRADVFSAIAYANVACMVLVFYLAVGLRRRVKNGSNRAHSARALVAQAYVANAALTVVALFFATPACGRESDTSIEPGR